MQNSLIKYFQIVLITFMCFNTSLLLAENHEKKVINANEKYSPVEMIMEHVADANEFHITTIGDKHIVFPLPCILFNYETKKFDFFLSSKLHHEAEVNGYVMKHGRVTRVDSNRFIDFSITKNVFSMFISLLFGVILFSIAAAGYRKRGNAAPKGIQSLLEPLIMFVVDDVIKANIGKNYMKYVPYLTSVFFFILINNLIGLIPIFPFSSNLSGNIAFTFAMAFIAFLVINLNANRNYWHHIFAMPGVPKLMLIILTPVEIMGIFLKPAVLMLRLFGNITGGHIAILSVVSLIFILGNLGQNIGGAIGGSIVAIPIVLFVNAMELLVAFLQAYVFILLTSIFIGTAIEEHGHH